MARQKTATLSTVIDVRVKRTLSEYCRRKGLKVRYVLEEALVEQLEDEMDREVYKPGAASLRRRRRKGIV